MRERENFCFLAGGDSLLRLESSGEGSDMEDRAAAARDDSPSDAGEPDAGIGVGMAMEEARSVEGRDVKWGR